MKGRSSQKPRCRIKGGNNDTWSWFMLSMFSGLVPMGGFIYLEKQATLFKQARFAGLLTDGAHRLFQRWPQPITKYGPFIDRKFGIMIQGTGELIISVKHFDSILNDVKPTIKQATSVMPGLTRHPLHHMDSRFRGNDNR